MNKGKLQECSDSTDPIVYSRLLRLSGYGVRLQYIQLYPAQLDAIFQQLVPLCVWTLEECIGAFGARVIGATVGEETQTPVFYKSRELF